MCWIPFLLTNSAHSALVNDVLLSDTNTSGAPCVAKRIQQSTWNKCLQLLETFFPKMVQHSLCPMDSLPRLLWPPQKDVEE